MTVTPEPCHGQEERSRVVSEPRELLVGQQEPSLSVIEPIELSHSQEELPTTVTRATEPCHNLEELPQTVTEPTEPRYDAEEPSQTVTELTEPRYDAEEPSQTVIEPTEPRYDAEEPSQTVTELTEPRYDAEEPSQTVIEPTEPRYDAEEPSQTVPHDQEKFSQTVTEPTEPYHDQVPSLTVTTPTEPSREELGPTEVDGTTSVTTELLPNKCTVSNLEAVCVPLGSPPSPVEDVEEGTTTSTPSAPPCVVPHSQNHTLHADDFVYSDAIQKVDNKLLHITKLFTPGQGEKVEGQKHQDSVTVVIDGVDDVTNQHGSDSVCENSEVTEELLVVRDSSSCVSDDETKDRTAGCSDKDAAPPCDNNEGVVTEDNCEAMRKQPVERGARGGTASREGSLGVEPTTCLVGRGTGVSERAALITRQQQVGRPTPPRCTRFPLDIICGTKFQLQHKAGEHSPSRLTRHRLSSLGHVQPLTLSPSQANNGARSKSASRIGSGHAESLPYTHESGLCGGGTEGSNSNKPENNLKALPPVPPPPPPPPSVLPIDAVLENKIKLTIDSCAGNVSNDNKVVEPVEAPAHWLTGGTEENIEPDGPPEVYKDDRIESDWETSGQTITEASCQCSNDSHKNVSSTVVESVSVDQVLVPVDEEPPGIVEGYFKGDTSELVVPLSGLNDLEVDQARGDSEVQCVNKVSPPHPSVSRQDDPSKEDLRPIIKETTPPSTAGEERGGHLQDEEPHHKSHQEQQKQEEPKKQKNQEQKQQEGSEVSEESVEVLTAAVPAAHTPAGVSHQPHQTISPESPHETDSSRRASLLNFEPNILYIDESESGSDLGEHFSEEASDEPSSDTKHECVGPEVTTDTYSREGCDKGDQQADNGPQAPFPHPLTPPPQTHTLTGEDIVQLSPNETPVTINKVVCELERNDSVSSDEVVPQPQYVVGVDTAAAPPLVCDRRSLGRDESVEEYEQALEVVTPDPSHGFSHSSASVATVVRVDTPNSPHNHMHLADDELEDEFVDASDTIDTVKGDACLVKTIPDLVPPHHTHSCSLTSQPVTAVGVTSREAVISGTISVSTSDLQSSGTSCVSSGDMSGTHSGGIVGTLSVSPSGGLSDLLLQDSCHLPIASQNTGSDAPEDGSVSSGSHLTDPDMLASASASSTGSETWWTSGGGPVARRDLLPLDEDEDEAHWRALLAVKIPESEEDPTGYESDEDFDTVDADMQRLEEKLKKFEKELGENNEGAPGEGEKIVCLPYDSALRSQDIEALCISPLPKVFPAVRSAKTKHLSLMTRLEVQEYEDSASESESESEAVSSSDSADFLFVKTKIKLKPGDRKCRSLDQKRSKDYNILNKSREDKKRGGRGRENSYGCEEQLDLSSLNLPVTTLEEETGYAIPDTQQPVMSDGAGGSSTPTGHDVSDECPAPPQMVNVPPDMEQLGGGGEETSHALLHCEDHILLGYIWHEEDGMSSVDFEGLEDFQSFEGQGALMIMFEDDNDDDMFCDELSDGDVLPEATDVSSGQQSSKEYLAEGTEGEDEPGWSRASGSNTLPRAPQRSRRGSERTFVAAFKNSLKKATKYLGPKSETQPRKASQGTEDSEWSQHNNNNNKATTAHLPRGLSYPERRCSMGVGVGEGSSAGVYNVQSGRVAAVMTHSPISDSEGPEAYCSSGEYYAAPAQCVNTSDEDPPPPLLPSFAQGGHFQPQNHTLDIHNFTHDTSGPPPAPPPRWVQRKLHAPQDLNAGVPRGLPPSVQGDCYTHSVLSQPPAPSNSHVLAQSSHTTTHTLPSTELPTDGNEMQFFLVGIPNILPARGETRLPVVSPGMNERLGGRDREPIEDMPPPLPAPPVYDDKFVPGDSWLPDNYPQHTNSNYSCVVPNHRLVRDNTDLPLDSTLHASDAPPALPSHKPTSVKQLKRKQQEKVLRQEAEEAVGCTFCMGTPLTRARPPEDSGHWRQPSPHPRGISDRRSWPPRVSCLVPLTRWSLPILTYNNLSPQTQRLTTNEQPFLYSDGALTDADDDDDVCPYYHPANFHDPTHCMLPSSVCCAPIHPPPDSADSQISLSEKPHTDTTTSRSPGQTSSPDSDSDPYWTPVTHLTSSHHPRPLACCTQVSVLPPSPSASPRLSLTTPALTTDSWTNTVDTNSYRNPHVQPAQLTSESWIPAEEHNPQTHAENHRPTITTVFWAPTVNTSQPEGERPPEPTHYWTPTVDTHLLSYLEEQHVHTGDTHETVQDAPNSLPSAHKPLSASTSVVNCPEASYPLTPSLAATLACYSCPLLIFMSVMDLTSEHVSSENGRACDRPTGSLGPPPPSLAHTNPPLWEAFSSTSSVEWDPTLKYSASESEVDSG
ncbi:hypothetical protein Hamer_G004319 [Homarus americanus]|uniref:Uncharacterized protein n=1 Tax=Homarus americanus TaxID=6706 RepID=A0A8J5MQ46_HOMAM|nr:hypothetical protein Hamer_G004319 [Homarus americanus]